MASAWTSRQLERLHQRRLRLVFGADDLDDLVEVQIRDQVAAKHFQPMLDLRLGDRRERRNSTSRRWSSHSRRHFREADDLRNAPLISTFMFSEMRLSSSVSLNSDSIISSGSTLRDFGSMTMRTSSADSSRMSPTRRQLLLVEQFGDPLDQPRLLHQPRNLRDDDDPGAARAFFLMPFGARRGTRRARSCRPQRSISCGIDDDAAGREVRPLDVFQQTVATSSSGLSIRCSAASQSSAALCGGIEVAMPTAMPCAPLASRFGNAPGRTTGSCGLAVIVRTEIDRVLVDAVEQQPRDFGHARFGVTIGGGIIAVDVAEIALAVDQRIARGKILREPHHAHHRSTGRRADGKMPITSPTILADFLKAEPGSSRSNRMP